MKSEREELLERTLWAVVRKVHGHKRTNGTLTREVDDLVQPVLFPMDEKGQPKPGAVYRIA